MVAGLVTLCGDVKCAVPVAESPVLSAGCSPSGVRTHGDPAPQEGVHVGSCRLSLGCSGSSLELPSLLPLAWAQEGRNGELSSQLR